MSSDELSHTNPDSFFSRKKRDEPESDLSFFDLFESIFKEKVNEWVENQEKEMEN